MTRFLLALLAMLTGIAITGQPVSARVCADEAAASRSVNCAVIADSAGERSLPAGGFSSAPDRSIAKTIWPANAPIVPARTVHVGVDRALE